MWMNGLILSVLIVLGSGCSSLHADEGAIAKSKMFAELEFTITLPADWEEIPKEELQWIKDPRQPVPNVDWRAGFRKRDPEGPLAFPYILVQKIGHRRQSEFQIRQDLKTYLQKHAVRNQGSRNGFSLITEAPQMEIDPENLIIWGKCESTYAGTFSIRVLSAAIPTEAGALAFHYYGWKERSEKMEPLFRDFVDTIRIAPGLEYQKRWTDRYPPWIAEYITSWFCGVGILVLLFVLFNLRKKRLQKLKSEMPGSLDCLDS